MAIDIRDLPDINDAEFQSYIKRPPSASNKIEPVPQPYSDEESADTRQRPTYASFGDSGTTATVSQYGTIMRISKYLGGENNPSKMFGLEFPDGSTPYFIDQRAEDFQQNLSVPSCGFGLQITGLDSLQLVVPKLEFLIDRWPQITYSIKGFNVRVQLFCQNGTVFQRFTLSKTLTSTEDLDIVLDVNFLMHQLDYMNDEDYECKFDHGPHGHSIIVSGQRTDEEKKNEENKNEENKDEENKDGMSEKARVVVGLFRNGDSKNLLLLDVKKGSKTRGIMKIKCPSQESETLELTAAFKLQYTKCSSDWKDFILPVSELDVDKIVQEPKPALNPDPWPFPHEDHLSWHLRRNLEHILSVCSIPLKPLKDGIDHGVTPIALTCGDFGDHRVSVSGSFFAFRYLLSMYEQLGKKLDADSTAQSFRSRIRNTCKGHLQWVAELNRNKLFASNLWVDGKIIEPNERTDLPSDSPANIPTHILKVTEFLAVFKEQEREDFIFVSEWLPSFVKSWIENLLETKNHLATTWQHIPDDPDIAKYRLSDHVWIWKALQSVEQLIRKVEEINPPLPDSNKENILELKNHLPNTKRRGDGASPWLKFTSDELRKQILRKFTLENDILKRMLSTTRSARETRYLFHSRDTVLYYGMEWGFFQDDAQQVSELWELLVQSQIDHDEGNDEVQWDNPLRYALALLMGVEDHQLDKNYSVKDMNARAKPVLLESSSKSGLFPGQIDVTTKEPVIFDGEIFRDSYFHAGFEIPYVLLSVESKLRLRTESTGDYQAGERGQLDNEEGNTAIEKEKETKGSEAILGPSRSPARDRKSKHRSTRRPSVVLSPLVTDMVDLFQSHLELNGKRVSAAANDGVWNIRPDGRAIPAVRTLKRNMPYSRFVDLSNIVELSEEWLYAYPGFLNFQPPNDKDAATILKQADGATIAKCIEGKTSKDDTREFSIKDLFNESPVPVTFGTLDVPKGKKQGKKTPSDSLVLLWKDKPYKEVWEYMQTKRTAEVAKKRCIFLEPGDCTGDCRVAALCYLASHDTEREHISQFFDRHGKVGEYINDDTIVASNFWETEVHLSFYQLFKGKSTEHKFTPVRAVESEEFSFLEDGSLISEAAMSFRIIGDYFDRYWTCHTIETYFLVAEETNISDSYWQQRKVLELILFERILSRVRLGAGDIIRAIQNCARKKIDVGENHLSGRLRFEDLTIAKLQEILQVLVVLRNNFATVLEIVELWKDRESTKKERARWTRSDEQKYRRPIQKRLALQERCISDLKNQHAKIEFLITLVTSAQEAVRSAMSLREAQNIRLFTYLTAFFLPVGLSSSFFGMGQIPDRNVVVTMIITAVIALFVTTLVLYCILFTTLVERLQQRFQRTRSIFEGNKREKLELKLDQTREEIRMLRERLRPSKKSAAEPKEGKVGDIESGSRHSDLIVNEAERS